jgi:preprotein translocase subunit SecY
MIQAIRNIWSIPELRKRVMFTFAMLGVYRVGGHIPIPGINTAALMQMFEAQKGTILGFIDLFSGQNFSRMTIFALGIMPYITASIILQLLTVVWPYLERLSKEGEAGRKKITQYTRYLTVLLSVVQAFGISIFLQTAGGNAGGQIVSNPGVKFMAMTALTLTTGTAFIMWLGEQISERGIGNGISLIIYAGIIVGLPGAVAATFSDLQSGGLSAFTLILLMAMMVGVVAAIVLVERAQRKIPIQYARRVVGRRVYGGASTFLPLRVNTAGVIPVIFASSILAIPQTIGQIEYLQGVGWVQEILFQLGFQAPLYALAYFLGIVFFCFFYVSIIFNPIDQADNMKKYGGFIPGIRPGKKTAEYIDRILTRLTFAGAMYLGLVSLLPMFLMNGFRVQMLPLVGPSLERFIPAFVLTGLNLKFFFGGTSLLIVVGVAMDTVQQIESQLIMRHYEGFMKGSRIRGRKG